MTAELLPCPFCGERLNHQPEFGYWAHPLSGCLLSTYKLRESQIGAWNTRPTAGIADAIGVVEEMAAAALRRVERHTSGTGIKDKAAFARGENQALLQAASKLRALSPPQQDTAALVEALEQIAERRYSEAAEPIDECLDIADAALKQYREAQG